MYVKDSLNYTVTERTSKEAFQALWIEIQFSGRPNIICRIIHVRQRNSPQRFQDWKALRLNQILGLCIMGDFNISLLGVEKCNYGQNPRPSLSNFRRRRQLC